MMFLSDVSCFCNLVNVFISVKTKDPEMVAKRPSIIYPIITLKVIFFFSDFIK